MSDECLVYVCFFFFIFFFSFLTSFDQHYVWQEVSFAIFKIIHKIHCWLILWNFYWKKSAVNLKKKYFRTYYHTIRHKVVCLKSSWFEVRLNVFFFQRWIRKNFIFFRSHIAHDYVVENMHWRPIKMKRNSRKIGVFTGRSLNYICFNYFLFKLHSHSREWLISNLPTDRYKISKCFWVIQPNCFQLKTKSCAQ